MPAERVDWRGSPGVVLEDDGLRGVVVPEPGGKLVSLFDKRAGREWLVPAAAGVVGPVRRVRRDVR